MGIFLSFIACSIGLLLITILCICFLYANGYNLSVLNRGRYLLFQEILLISFHTECIYLIYYIPSEKTKLFFSIMFIISNAAFITTYFLFMYRLKTLNDIEFGKFPSGDYKRIYSRLGPKWNIKMTVISTMILCIPELIIYLFSSQKPIIDLLDLNSNNKIDQAQSLYYFSLSIFEFLVLTYVAYFVLKGKFRLTVKIEVFINWLLWLSFYSYRYILSQEFIYVFLSPLRNFALLILMINSLWVRIQTTKVPCPPLFDMSHLFIYENKIVYKVFHEFLEDFIDQEYLKCLELGVYINMQLLEGNQRHLNAIEKICEELKIFRGSKNDYFEVLDYVEKKNAYSFEIFQESPFYSKLKAELVDYSELFYL